MYHLPFFTRIFSAVLICIGIVCCSPNSEKSKTPNVGYEEPVDSSASPNHTDQLSLIDTVADAVELDTVVTNSKDEIPIGRDEQDEGENPNVESSLHIDASTSSGTPEPKVILSSGIVNDSIGNRPHVENDTMEIRAKETSIQAGEENLHPQRVDHWEWDNLLKTFVNSEGKVNYQGILESRNDLIGYLDQLQKTPPTVDWSRDEKLAFWINAYNAFTIQLILQHYPIESIRNIDQGNPWEQQWVQIGDQKYSLNDIEHEVIRKQFKDPRIHFALNCAAKSCPPLANFAFKPENLEHQLENRTKLFINHPDYNQISSSQIRLSRIFDWYREDFDDLVKFLNLYLEEPLPDGLKIDFLNYDWNLNQ